MVIVMGTEFTENVINIIKLIPYGKVATYGLIAKMSGSPKASRQVSYILHSMSSKYDLPWHRVVNRSGMISLKQGRGYEEQKELLISEGVTFNEKDRINLNEYLWDIDKDG
jgi:methylated-DNA-protein-cysteine methyltransferase-like protein